MCSGSGLWDGWICWFQGDLWRWYGSDMELYSATRWDDLLTSTWPWFLELLKKPHHWRCCQHETVKWLPHKHCPYVIQILAYIYILILLVSGSLNSHQSFILAVWQQPFPAYVRSIFHRENGLKGPPADSKKSQGLSLHCHCPDPAGSLWWTWQTSVWFPCGRNHGLPSERRISRAHPWHTTSSSTNSFRFEHWLSWLLWNLSGA